MCLVSAHGFSAQNQRSATIAPGRTQSTENRTQSTEARTSRPVSSTTVSARSAVQTARGTTNVVTSRSGITNIRKAMRPVQTTSASAPAVVSARASIAPTSSSMGDSYNTCRDAYFTCMDQFCANKDEAYRRCACSSRLDGLREMADQVNQTQEQVENFVDYNIDAISKTAKEVAASLTATTGESTVLDDKSQSAQTLAGISEVLVSTKTKSLSTSGTLDIAGDIGEIWSTPDFIGGSDIANMEGEKLYSAVHSQCLDLVASACPREATLDMVVSAYGMYIEQDCNVVQASLEGKQIAAATIVRTTGQEMETARLENYNAHNSTEINDCIAQVRKDLTADTACGTDFVHCLDTTGMYLDFNTGAPIYSTNFFKLEKQTSLDGDFMNLNTNRLLLATLENYKSFAERGLDTCRDVADDVWYEFKRQTVIEIYQAQQARVKEVRDECLSVVNNCYDEKIGQLKNFANIDDQMLIGQSVETAEALCEEKMTSCSNVFGGGSNGLASLLAFVTDLGSAKISENCEESLNEYIHQVCAVTTGDLDHSYPYACRVRNPGSYACELNSTSSSCLGTQDGSVYNLLVKYARENCVRTDYPADDLLPADIMGYVNKIFDNVSYEMRLMLKEECELYSGEWLETGEKSNISLYTQLVSASDLWGACISPYCAYQGDAWLNTNGVKICCPANSIADTSCTGVDSPDLDCTAENCREITCPDNAAIDTSVCTDSDFVISNNPPTLGGCIGRTDSGSGASDEQLPYCKCSANYYSIPHNYNDLISEDVISADQGTCWPQCGANSSWNASCTDKGIDDTLGGTGTTSSENEGCLSKYCRCNTGYKFVEGDEMYVPDYGLVPGAAGVLPTALKNKTSISSNTKTASVKSRSKSIKIARASSSTIPDPISSSSIDRCVYNCPENSHPDETCPVGEIQPQCGTLYPPSITGVCISENCRCDPGYCSDGTLCRFVY